MSSYMLFLAEAIKFIQDLAEDIGLPHEVIEVDMEDNACSRLL